MLNAYAEVGFDTTRCAEGVWVMNITKTTTKKRSNASIGDPSPEPQQVVDDFEPVVEEEQLATEYRMNRKGWLVRSVSDKGIAVN